ncbi:MAG: ABC transporter ATP-binding protein, partial [Actinomycetota bacterium]|nr:ABC transporter ATP-binding protein [Actinomycetota bacterium]
DKQLAAVRGRDMAMVFQDPTTALNPVHTVGRHLADAVRAHQDVGRRQAGKRAIELLSTVGIPEPARRAGSYPHEFSGGMRQRVLIAMAMANDPDVIIADEPTTALDVTVQAQVLETLEKVQVQTRAAIVLITHDLGVVARMADRVMVMYAGRAVETGPVDAVYHRSRMPYTLALLRSIPAPRSGDGAVGGGKARLASIEGAVPSLADLPPGCPFWPRCALARGECRAREPELRVAEGADHRAACHFSEDLGPAR